MTTEKINTHSTATTLAIAAICFFAPVIQNQIKKNNFNLNKEDEIFVKSYIQYGYLPLTILTLLIVTIVAKNSNNRQRLNSINIILIALTLILVIGGIIGALGGKTLTNTKQWSTNELVNDKPRTEQWVESWLLYFVPIYNQYVLYKEPNNIVVKESILRRILICIATIIDPSNISSILLITLTIMRAITQTLNIEIRWWKAKSIIDTVFIRFPSELAAYPIASIQRIVKWWHKQKTIFPMMLEQRKKHYQHEYINFKTAQKRYGLVIAISVLITLSYIKKLQLNPEYSLDILIRLIIIGNLATKLITKNIPTIPIIEELRSYIQHFVPKRTWWKDNYTPW